MEKHEIERLHVIPCACHAPEHVIHFQYWRTPKEDDPEVYLSVCLNDGFGFWRRLWTGIRYVLGHKASCGFGHFDTWILHEDDLGHMIGILEAYRKDIREQKEK